MNNLSVFSAYGSFSPVIVFLMVIDLALKGITLYKSARRDQKIWFVALLLVNSLGILPVIYLLVNKDVLAVKAVAPKKVAKKTRRK